MIAHHIPSPGDSVWDVGPLPIRAYALCIIAGVVVAVWWGERRWRARGGRPGQISDMAIWAVPFGIVGGRLYHVATDYGRYFGEGNNPVTALYVWQGGLGIWGAIAMGALGAYVYARLQGLRMPPVADALAPCLLAAQAIGRWGNWFNQELFGKPLDAFWALEIDRAHRPDGYGQFDTFHPTFLYEFVWNLAAAAFVVWADRRFKLGHGRVFALYVMAYCAGRGWIEHLRIDPVQADDVLGLRLNVWTSVILFLVSLAYFVVVGRRRPGREDSVWRAGYQPVDGPDADESVATAEGEATDDETRAQPASAESPDSRSP